MGQSSGELVEQRVKRGRARFKTNRVVVEFNDDETVKEGIDGLKGRLMVDFERGEVGENDNREVIMFDGGVAGRSKAKLS